MHQTLFFSLVAVMMAAQCPAQNAPEAEGFKALFNGKDLTGWVVVNTAPSTWQFNDDGILTCTGKPIGEIRTERMYQNFILELEWRHLVPGGNAGVFVWADDITAKGQPFHRGIEVQVLDTAYGESDGHTTHGDIFPIHGATMEPINGRGGSRAFPTESRSKPSPEWNHYRIECRDGAISLAVNGKVVTKGEKCNPRKGYICLESEGGVAHYRNVKLKELPDSPIEADQIAIADRGYQARYNGLDFSGWKPAEGWLAKDWILQSGKGAAPLSSDTPIQGDFGIIIDVRLNESSGTARVLLGKQEILAINAKDFGLEKLGAWHRFEGVLEKGMLSWSLNGARRLPGIPVKINESSAGSLTLAPEGPLDWANIYIRAVK